MAEIPEFSIHPHKGRIVLARFTITFILAILFYVGIAINVALLRINIPGNVTILIVSVLLLLVIIQTLLSYVQTSKRLYTVYQNRLQIEGTQPKYVMFAAIQDMKEKRNFFDKMFNTGTIKINPTFVLEGIPNFDQSYAYIKQMAQYGKQQYSQQ